MMSRSTMLNSYKTIVIDLFQSHKGGFLKIWKEENSSNKKIDFGHVDHMLIKPVSSLAKSHIPTSDKSQT